MSHQALAPEFRALIDEDAPVIQIGNGFEFAEDRSGIPSRTTSGRDPMWS